MTIKGKLKKYIEQLTRAHIYSELPRGVSFLWDIQQNFPDYTFDVVFDVGANIGHMTRKHLQTHPHSKIYCFEPVSSTYKILTQNLQAYPQVRCFQLALSSSNGEHWISAHKASKINRFIDQATTNESPSELIQTLTLDHFCQKNNVPHINFLKIDTEGHDLAVLSGAKIMLQKQQIDFIEVEASMNKENNAHVSLEDLKRHLEAHQYFFFGVYSQVREWQKKLPHLRRANLVFISHRLSLAYSYA